MKDVLCSTPPPVHRRALVVVSIAVFSLAAAFPSTALAQATAPSLGSAKSFAVLAGQTVTNTGPSTLHGDLGVSPGTAITGFPPGLVIGGAVHAADAVALAAENDVTIAYNALASQPCTLDLTGQGLGGKTLVAGAYCFTSSAQLTGTVTLNAEGNANAVFIFKMGSTLTTASKSRVRLINGAQPCNVFWQVGSSATVGTYTSFIGNILALTSITVQTGASLNGRALARNGAVTLDTNDVIFSSCTPGTTSGGDTGDIPASGGGSGNLPPIVAGPGPICTDTKPPTVVWGQLTDNSWTATVNDACLGLASIVVDLATTSNATMNIPIFAPGTKKVVVTATSIINGVQTDFGIKATDVCGNVTWWDPIAFTITAGETLTFDGISRIEHFVTIENNGLQGVIITINGEERRVFLGSTTTIRNINIGLMMSPGDDNTVTFEAIGFGRGAGGSANISLHPR